MRGLLFLLMLASTLTASDSTIPGEITTPFPTINHLAVEWSIEGDDNLNASCAVRYRKAVVDGWQEGPPLRRVPAGSSRSTSSVITWTNRLSGSLFDLWFVDLHLAARAGFCALGFIGEEPAPIYGPR